MDYTKRMVRNMTFAIKRNADSLNEDKIGDIYHICKPQLMWEMDSLTLFEIERLKDKKSLCMPDGNYINENGLLWGLPITISDEPGIRLVTIFRKSEHSKLVVMEE